MLTGLIDAFFLLLTDWNLVVLALGVLLGIVAGSVPGISPAMAVALLVPFSFTLEPATAFVLFTAVYQAANYGGSIPAIVLNTPGTASAMITGIDGYPLHKKGFTAQTLHAALLSSVAGGLLGAIVLIAFVGPAARIAVNFSPLHYVLLAFAGLASIVLFAGQQKLAAALAVFLGLVLATVGLDDFTGGARFTFGSDYLTDGVTLIPVMIGLFAITEALLIKRHLPEVLPAPGSAKNSAIGSGSGKIGKALGSLARDLRFLRVNAVNQIRSALIGVFVGVLPGAGATVASFFSYNFAKKFQKSATPSGCHRYCGVIASEAANSASVGGALIPLLALGIPGSATDAVLLGAFTLHGLAAGPLLIQKAPEIVYSIFVTVIIANLVIYVLGRYLSKLWGSLSKINLNVLQIAIILVAVLGCYALRGSLSDVVLSFIFGLIGLVCRAYRVPLSGIVLGLVLGVIFESNLRRAVILLLS